MEQRAYEDMMKEQARQAIQEGCQEALQKGRQEGLREGHQIGRQEGMEQGIRILIETCRELGLSKGDTKTRVMEKFDLEKDAEIYMDQYW